MRPQQNRRMRGRGNNNNNNNNRKGPNPLTRSYESNGPDVKIRGSAQQIAEKYTTLARDAQTSGDRVMAENYLQHAEHYNRLIMAAQAQMPQHQQVRDNRDDDDQDDDGEENFNQVARQDQPQHHRSEQQPQQHHNGSGPQPVIEGTPAEVALKQGNIAQTEGGERREQVNGEADGQEEDAAATEAAPRRARRPRRPRQRNEEAAADGNSAEAVDEPVSEAAQ